MYVVSKVDEYLNKDQNNHDDVFFFCHNQTALLTKLFNKILIMKLSWIEPHYKITMSYIWHYFITFLFINTLLL